MAITPGALSTGGPAAPARPLLMSPARTSRRILADRWASRLVVIGGIFIIASILAILFVIAAEVYPLFKPPTAQLVGAPIGGAPAGEAPVSALGVDEYREAAYQVLSGGVLQVTDLKRGRVLPAVPIPGLDGARVTRVSEGGGGKSLIATSDGRVLPLDMQFEVSFRDGARSVTPQPAFGQPSALDPDKKRPILDVTFAAAAGGPVTVARVGPAELILQTVVEKKALIGGSRREESLAALPIAVDGDITALQLDRRGEDLFVGTSRGQLVRYDLRDKESAKIECGKAHFKALAVGESPAQYRVARTLSDLLATN